MMQVLIRTMIKKKYIKLFFDTFYSTSPGLTLIELILGFTLLVIFLGGAITLNLFGLRTFAAGEMQTSAHQALRRTADRIADELRYATKIELLREIDGDYEYFIFIDEDNHCRSKKCIILQNEAGSRNILLDPFSIDNKQTNMDMSLKFDLEDHLVNFVISVDNIIEVARAQTGDYEIASSVYLNNEPEIDDDFDCGDNDQNPCTVVGYSLPAPL